MAHASTVTFSEITSGAGSSVTINGPQGPTDVEDAPKWASDLSAAHTRISYQLTANDLISWSLQFDTITVAQKTAFVTFFNTIAEGPTNEVYYTHTDGTQYTVRFVDTNLRWRRMDGNIWGLALRLEMGSQVSA